MPAASPDPAPSSSSPPSPPSPRSATPAAAPVSLPEPAGRRRGSIAAALVALLLVGAGLWAWRQGWIPGLPGPAAAASGVAAGAAGAGPGRGGGRGGTPPFLTPVLAPAATRGSMPERLGALGTVTARATVTVRAQVSGRLMKLHFNEGQLVKAGELLAEIDPRSFQVALDSALAQLARDEAELAAAEVDLRRYRTLLAQDSIAAQQVDTQAATVAQLKATVAADKANVAAQRLQLGYTRVTAPVGGRVGFRQVDVGNLVASSDANGLVVITQVQPITVVFPIPQQKLAAVQQRLAGGATLAVEAWDGDNRRQIGSGQLVAIDNQIDTTTGTVKLKAEFTNRDFALYPNQFVNVKLTLTTYDDVTLIPAAAVQQGSRGPYVFVVQPDSTVVQRLPRLGPGDDRVQAVLEGVAPGERVVVDGIDRLREGMKVELLEQRETPVAQPRHRGPRGAEASASAASSAAASAAAAAGPASAASAADAPARRGSGAWTGRPAP